MRRWRTQYARLGAATVRSMVCAAALAAPAAAHAQTNLQLWTNLTLDWVRDNQVTYEIDFEPKALIQAPPDDPSWRGIDVTPAIEYAWKQWLDVGAELALARTLQTDDLQTWEVTPRVTMRFHLFNRQEYLLFRERRARRRLVLRDLVRVEWRSLLYSDDTPAEHTTRFRNRLEFLFPWNRQNISDDRLVYTLADWEWFVPLDDPSERFANRQRIRAGTGYRHNFAWRYEVVYMWTRSRDTTQEDFSTSDNIIDFRVKRVF